MAISIQHNPGQFFSLHGDVIFTVVDIVKASDPVTYPDYRYVADVYVGSLLVARLKAYPNPTNKIGIFNIGNILRSYQAAVFNPVNNTIDAQSMELGEFYVKATVKFGEEYNFTQYSDLTVDTERIYYGHYNGRMIGVTTNLSAKSNRAATNRPTTTPVYTGSRHNFIPWFSFFSTTVQNIVITIKTYTKAGTLVGTQGPFAVSSPKFSMQILNFSPSAINAMFSGFINPAFADYYVVEMFGNPNDAATTVTLRFDLTCEPKHEVFSLHFLNKYGGFESRDFTKVSRKTIDIDRSEFGKLGYAMDSSGVISYASTGNVYNETRSIYSSQYKEKMTLNTDILTNDEYQWLSELVLSPLVYIEQVVSGTSYFLPCVITANNYEFRKTVNDSLTNLTLDIEFGEQYNAQYR